jgi:hypothetical protein
MSIRIMGAMLALIAAPWPAASAPRGGGTIAVTVHGGADRGDPLQQVSIDAATAALGMKGFTILDDPDHAAYVAEVMTTRTEVGTSIARGKAAAPLVTGLAVTIPTSGGKSVVALERTELEIRIRRRGEQRAFWSGAAVTVRSAGARGAGAEQVATTLSQAALGPYPTTVATAISIP